MDQPKFTQPLLYDVIGKHPTTYKLYSDKLVAEGSITREKVTAMQEQMTDILNKAFEAAKSYQPKEGDWLCSNWQGFKGPQQLARIKDTGVPQVCERTLETVFLFSPFIVALTRAIATGQAEGVGAEVVRVAKGLLAASQHCKAAGESPRYVRKQQAAGLGHGRTAVVRHAAGRRQSCASVRPGCAARHLLASPLLRDRSSDGREVQHAQRAVA